jgi:hypothetical protein
MKKNMKKRNRKFHDLYEAWSFLEEHPMFQYEGSSLFCHCLDIEVVRVDPRTRNISDDPSRNTATRVWLECGPWERPEDLRPEERPHLPHGIASVDLQLLCGGATFEEAIIKLATLVRRRYGNSRHPQRRIRQRWTLAEKAMQKAHGEDLAGKSRPSEKVLAELRNQGGQAIGKTPKSLAALQEQARRSGADKLTLEEIEAEIAAVRRARASPVASN